MHVVLVVGAVLLPTATALDTAARGQGPQGHTNPRITQRPQSHNHRTQKCSVLGCGLLVGADRAGGAAEPFIALQSGVVKEESKEGDGENRSNKNR
jgi:hypothetical protein